jgi:hypothetical protein
LQPSRRLSKVRVAVMEISFTTPSCCGGFGFFKLVYIQMQGMDNTSQAPFSWKVRSHVQITTQCYLSSSVSSVLLFFRRRALEKCNDTARIVVFFFFAVIVITALSENVFASSIHHIPSFFFFFFLLLCQCPLTGSRMFYSPPLPFPFLSVSFLLFQDMVNIRHSDLCLVR